MSDSSKAEEDGQLEQPQPQQSGAQEEPQQEQSPGTESQQQVAQADGEQKEQKEQTEPKEQHEQRKDREERRSEQNGIRSHGRRESRTASNADRAMDRRGDSRREILSAVTVGDGSSASARPPVVHVVKRSARPNNFHYNTAHHLTARIDTIERRTRADKADHDKRLDVLARTSKDVVNVTQEQQKRIDKHGQQLRNDYDKIAALEKDVSELRSGRGSRSTPCNCAELKREVERLKKGGEELASQIAEYKNQMAEYKSQMAEYMNLITESRNRTVTLEAEVKLLTADDRMARQSVYAASGLWMAGALRDTYTFQSGQIVLLIPATYLVTEATVRHFQSPVHFAAALGYVIGSLPGLQIEFFCGCLSEARTTAALIENYALPSKAAAAASCSYRLVTAPTKSVSHKEIMNNNNPGPAKKACDVQVLAAAINRRASGNEDGKVPLVLLRDFVTQRHNGSGSGPKYETRDKICALCVSQPDAGCCAIGYLERGPGYPSTGNAESDGLVRVLMPNDLGSFYASSLMAETWEKNAVKS